jgi:hypothetical protein
MKVEETVMNEAGIEYWWKIGGIKKVTEAQAERSFKAGIEEGIRQERARQLSLEQARGY